MAKKKIVIIGSAYPYRGGQALVEGYLFQKLTELGYDVNTISFKVLYPKIFFPGTTQYDESETIFFDHRDKIFRIINSINPFTWFKAVRKLRQLNPDAIIFVWWMPFFGPVYWTIGKLIKLFLSPKIVFLIENYISHENRWFDKLSSKITLNLADHFICQSGYTKTSVEQNHNKPISQTTLSIFDCYNLKNFTQATAREYLGIKTKRVVLFFGLIRAYKGLDKLILAFNGIKEEHPDTTLLIVGEAYEDIYKYKQLIKDEGIEDCTILQNKFIPNEKVEPYFKAADVLCLPYNSATQSGITMMAYGFRKPVIVTNVGGLPELIVEGKTGSVIEENNPIGIAKTVNKFLDNIDSVNHEDHIANLSENLGYGNFGEIFEEIMK